MDQWLQEPNSADLMTGGWPAKNPCCPDGSVLSPGPYLHNQGWLLPQRNAQRIFQMKAITLSPRGIIPCSPFHSMIWTPSPVVTLRNVIVLGRACPPPELLCHKRPARISFHPLSYWLVAKIFAHTSSYPLAHLHPQIPQGVGINMTGCVVAF